MTVRVNGRLVQYAGGPTSEGDTHGIGNPLVRVRGIPVATIGQLTLGHESFPPTAAVQGSETVRVGSLPVVRFGDAYAPHTDGVRTHIDLAAPIL